MKKIEKKEIFKSGNFTVSSYDFEIPNGERAWKILKLVELKTVKRRWSDETQNYYLQSQYITISRDQLASFLGSQKASSAD